MAYAARKIKQCYDDGIHRTTWLELILMAGRDVIEDCVDVTRLTVQFISDGAAEDWKREEKQLVDHLNNIAIPL